MKQGETLRAALRSLSGERPLRNIPKQTDSERGALVAQTGGAPVLDLAAHSNEQSSPFIDYIYADILHSLAQPRSEHGEEMTFITMSQIMELLFKLLNHEFLRAQAAIRADELAEAKVILRRTMRVLEFMSHTWSVLSTLTPEGYLAFRDHLGIGSGFESSMYRRLEFILGNKQPRMLEPHKHIPRIHAALSELLAAPSLYDDVIALLARRGCAIDADALERDWTQPYKSNASVLAAWIEIYRTRSPGEDRKSVV